MRLDLDPALASSKWDVHERRLPRHQHGEAADLVERDVRMEPKPALVGPTRVVVLDSETPEDLETTTVHGDPDLDRDLPSGVGHRFPQRELEIESLRRFLVELLDRLERRLHADLLWSYARGRGAKPSPSLKGTAGGVLGLNEVNARRPRPAGSRRCHLAGPWCRASRESARLRRSRRG